jgi:hypothetical protein
MRWSRLVAIGMGATVLLALKPQDAATDAASLTASQILERMATVYATCKSYRDTGMVRDTRSSTDSVGGSPSATGASAGYVPKPIPFRTAFVRPGSFRFEFSVEALDIQLKPSTYRYIVWADGSEVRTWWDMKPGVHRHDMVGSALFETGAWSHDSALTIPPMLMPSQVRCPRLSQELADLERLRDATLDNVPCFVVNGKVKLPGITFDVTTSIDQSTFLVRQIHKVTDLGGTHIDYTITYQPEIDVEIAKTELAFETPRVAVLPVAGQR